jgi:inhibitor of cysteine peptidase
MTSLTEEDAGRSVTVTAGDEIAITLAENPTTGYRWTIDSITSELTLMSSEFATPPDGRAGAGGRRTILLHAVRPGAGEVQLRYERSWQSGSDQGRRCQFQFTITPA